MFKVSDILLWPNADLYFSTTLSLTCLERFFGLHGAHCLVGLLTVGPLGTHWDHVTDHVTEITGGLYLTSYVTSKKVTGRGFIAKQVSTYLYACTTLHFFYFFLFHNSFPFCVAPFHRIQKKNPFKLQVSMQQNRKNAKRGEYFCKALYSARMSTDPFSWKPSKPRIGN